MLDARRVGEVVVDAHALAGLVRAPDQVVRLEVAVDRDHALGELGGGAAVERRGVRQSAATSPRAVASHQRSDDWGRGHQRSDDWGRGHQRSDDWGRDCALQALGADELMS